MTPLRLGCTIRLLLLAVLPVTAQAVATNETVHAFDMATPGYQYRFPHDHGAHERFRTEWWYYTGHVVAADGHRFGFELTFFRRGMPPDQVQTLPSRWSIQQLYLAHLALTDLDAGRFYYADKVSREGLGKAGADTDRLHVWVDRWSLLTNDPAASRHQLQAATDSVAINLTVIPKKPPVIHGHDGLSRKGADPGQASHYYSLTHLATEGQIRVGTETFAVTGLSWMDHEFGSADLGLNVVGWDWFSLQLSDSTELMWYSLRRADGSSDPVSSGTLVLADGRAHALDAQDLNIEPLAHWTSPRSNGRYPQRWRLTSATMGLDVTVESLLADQELDTARSTGVTYWEGAVSVSGQVRGAPVTGRGYVEMTGYAERFTPKL
ncbi:MAG TPA: lipocalin-like domain-containing protein [Nitrospira sp.]|nr:carotenoid 1,2-hydratase [Nitrospira sp.]MBX3370053.1 carotenoid 1,2-hydratase [Nitrospira sp.]MBX7038022.1 carotenoid 1,2-hydratase [Nitrospira sp.]MCW5793028.1 carotenoid 1,2-hydratase [Nitrospira sp.]HMU28894.1 lipocalin-like domain-containing protein [Nitrospira sp.]